MVEKVLKQRESIHSAIESLYQNKSNVIECIDFQEISLLVVMVIGTTLLSRNTVIDICFSSMHEKEMDENHTPVDLFPLKLHLTSYVDPSSSYISLNQ